MTAKEKAKEIHGKFDSLLPCEGTTTGQTPVECTLIAVDEILLFIDNSDFVNLYWLNYWQEVKEEIELL